MWGKVESNQFVSWLPLYIHMRDVCEVSRILWRTWLPESTKRTIMKGLSSDDEDFCLKVISFLAASHDVGKAIPAFQSGTLFDERCDGTVNRRLSETGLRFRTDLNDRHAVPHSLASQMLLERNGVDRSLSSVAGSHHGIPPNLSDLSPRHSFPENTGFEDGSWVSVQNELFDYCLGISSMSREEITGLSMEPEAQMLVAGLVSMADWIGSNLDYFPLIDADTDTVIDYDARIREASELIQLPVPWIPSEVTDSTFEEHFGYKLRPFQDAVVKVVSRMPSPGMVIVEASTGEGKTEAAMVASEILSNRFGYGGTMFALPTQSTADGIFGRFVSWMGTVSDSPHTIFLAHGRSKYNQTYTSLPRSGWGCGNPGSEKAYIHSWFDGPKKGLLSDFCVGTVDQVLMCGLKQRYGQMRYLAISNKVVIIDECHAYDAYMGSYLCKALEWLGACGTSVVLLSATMPPGRKRELIEAYSMGAGHKCDQAPSDPGYPLITTFSDGRLEETVAESSVKGRVVKIRWDGTSSPEEIIGRYSGVKPIIGIIVNTVRRAQKLYAHLKKTYADARVVLLHSRFTCFRRSEIESEILEYAGKNSVRGEHLTIIVGTQVIEQSLDIDMDMLLTDLCPVDLLIQRIGRLHRHQRERPEGLSEPMCIVMDDRHGDFEEGTQHVYSKMQLFNTRELVGSSISVPEDVPCMVSAAYGPPLIVPHEIADEYAKAVSEDRMTMESKQQAARVFQIKDPWKVKSLVGMLENRPGEAGDQSAKATVRDIDGSIEVIIVGSDAGGTFYDVNTGDMIPDAGSFTDEDAFRLTGSKVSLPAIFTSKGWMGGTIEDIIGRMSSIPREWIESRWLAGEMILVLDGRRETELRGIRIRYDAEMGLIEIE